MKKELIYFRNCTIRTKYIDIEKISLSLFSGESTAFLGLASSGKRDFINALCGDIPFKSAGIFLDSKRLSQKEISNTIHKIRDINYSISNWTVYEYVGLVNSKDNSLFLNKKKLSKEISLIFQKLGLDIDVNKSLDSLSELEKRLIDVVKACINSCKIILIEDELTGLTTLELISLKENIKRIIKKQNVSLIINVNSYKVNSILADNYIIFKKGEIIKKCPSSKISNKEELERLLIDSHIGGTLNTENNIIISESKEVVYRVNNINLNNNISKNFYFRKASVSSIISLNRDDKKKIFDALSGRKTDSFVDIYIDEEKVYLKNIEDFVKNKIVSINNLLSLNELIDNFSIGENIIIPSLAKFNSFEYSLNAKKMKNILEKQLLESICFDDDDAFNINETFRENCIIFERWYVFKPKVLIIYEPFNNCDVKGVNLIKSYISKFKKNDTAIIIINSRKSDIYDISDFIYKI